MQETCILSRWARRRASRGAFVLQASPCFARRFGVKPRPERYEGEIGILLGRSIRGTCVLMDQIKFEAGAGASRV